MHTTYLQEVFTTRRLALAYQRISEESDRSMSCSTAFMQRDGGRLANPFNYEADQQLAVAILDNPDSLMEFIVLTYLQKDYTSRFQANS